MVEVDRLHYFQRQYLGALDFEAEQTYHRDKERRHELGQHTWGIVTGLELIEVPSENGGDEVDVFISAGMAVDGFGREIFVFFPVQLDLGLFDGFSTAKYYEVYLAYTEELTGRPGFGYEQCDVDTQFSRVRETFRVVVGNQTVEQDPIIVDGKEAAPLDPTSGTPPTPEDRLSAIPDDLSVPYQEFPDDQNVNRWLIRLGSVNCDPLGGKLKTSNPDQLVRERRYVGVVAQDVFAPASTLNLRPRAAFADMDAAPFADVQGRLQVEGRIIAKKDILLHGGKLSFQGLNGDEGNMPLWMQRTVNGTGFDLRIHIGDKAAANTRLTIGPTDAGSEKPVLAVRSDDKVEIVTGSLDFDTDAASRPPYRQMLDLRKGAGDKYLYGIGVQTSTTYFRTEAEFSWFKGGVHADGQSDPGTGGTLQMRMDDQARLYFGAQTRQMLNLWNTGYGIGVQPYTFYLRAEYDFCWFRRGSHSDNRNDPGSGGALAMKLDEASNLSVSGGVTANGNITLSGGRLELQMSGGNTDTDPMYLERHNNSFDHNDLRVVIGDNITGDDRFVVGPLYFGDGLFKPMFTVANNGDTTVAGKLTVSGRNNLIRVFTEVNAWQNAGINAPSRRTINYASMGFLEVYVAYVVLQGYSIWPYENNPDFTVGVNNHAADANAISQHIYAKLIGHSNTEATVETYCSESRALQEYDNTVLFTLVVMGRTAS